MSREEETGDTGPENPGVAVPEFTAYRLYDSAPPLVPAESGREWMDATAQRFAYRCTPLGIANGSGWALLSPYDFTVTWNGGRGQEAITVSAAEEAEAKRVAGFAQSHFGEGVLTLHPGYLFQTSPGWALWVRGMPNQQWMYLHPLEGVVETDWLPYTFTMNWRFTAPGTARFHKGDPFCFLTLVPHQVLGAVQPVIRSLADNPGLAESNRAWSEDRRAFGARLAARDPDTMAEGWQRYYLKGEAPDGTKAGFHLTRQRLRTPKRES